uniref:CSON006976 protein n=1 Tax=Culicoides sonorensis TaxID=179676 RepID=A0A336KMA3_CULSO
MSPAILIFKASDSWKSNFLKRHHIDNRKITGESGGLDRSAADKFIDENLPQMIANYSLENIFNADKAAEQNVKAQK